MKFWHGTDIDKWSNIQRLGLRPRYGYDSSQFLDPRSEAPETQPQILNAIYLHSRKKDALEDYDINKRLYLEGHNRLLPIVLEVTLPESEKVNLGKTSEGETFYIGSISPKYIRRIL